MDICRKQPRKFKARLVTRIFTEFDIEAVDMADVISEASKILSKNDLVDRALSWDSRVVEVSEVE